MDRALEHRGDLHKLARERVDHLGTLDKVAPAINLATSAETDLVEMYEGHRRGKALAAKEAVKHFDRIERTEVPRPTETMREENTKHRKSKRSRWRGE